MYHGRLVHNTDQNAKEQDLGSNLAADYVLAFVKLQQLLFCVGSWGCGSNWLDHRTYLIETHLTDTGAGAQRMPGCARLQPLPVHVKARIESRP